jgi:hypothetical protein
MSLETVRALDDASRFQEYGLKGPAGKHTEPERPTWLWALIRNRERRNKSMEEPHAHRED